MRPLALWWRQLTVWINGHYTTVSRLLVGLTVLAFGVTIYGFSAWRRSLQIDFACEVSSRGGYSQSEICLDSRGFLGWMLGFWEAAPYIGVTMLTLTGIVYFTLGKPLGLRNKASFRRESLRWLIGICCLFFLVPLIIWGIVELVR